MATRRRASRQSLTGSISDLQRRVRYLQNRPSPTSLGNQSVVRSALQPRAVSNDQIALNAISNDQIQADAIKQAQIDNNSVGTSELIGLSVTNEKIAIGTIENDRMAEESIDYINMIPNSVREDTLDENSVSFRALQLDAVGNENMLGDSVGSDELQNDSVGSGALQNNSVGNFAMQSDSIGNAELQSGSVGTSQLQNGAVTSSKIASGNVGSTQLSNSSVTNSKIANGAVSYAKISSGTSSSIVSAGLTTGFGIRKSGNNIRVETGQISTKGHRHSYVDRYYSRDSLGGTLTSFRTANVTTSGDSSSVRYKTDISDHQPSDPKKLLNLTLKKFKYKRSKAYNHAEKNREWMHGYMAEELIEMGFEEVVTYDAEGNPDKVNYGLLSGFVLELVKLQQDEIELLKQKISEVEDKK